MGVGRSCSPWHPHSSAWAWWRRTDAEVSRACCGLSGCVQLPRKPHGMAGAPRGGRGRAWGELSPLSLRSQIGAPGEAAAQGSSVSSTVADEAEERRPVSLAGAVLPESGGAMGWRGGRAPRGGRGRAWGELSRCAFFGVNTRLQPSPCKRTVRWPPASPGWLRVSFTFGVFTPIRKLRVQLQAWRPMRGARATVVPFTHFRPHYKRERMKFEVGVPISVSVF